DLRAARESGRKVPMLTCYDYTTARLMEQAGVRALLVGDTAAAVILGHPSTLPAPLNFMIELTAAVRRGAPNSFGVADMPFGSYHASTAHGVKNVCKMVQLSQADCVKLEVARSHVTLVQRLADAGVAVMAHLGLRPQTVGLVGGYRFQGRNVREAEEIVRQAEEMQNAGAAAILLEAVPPEVGKAVVNATTLPVIGCGAGPACHGSVVVVQDLLGLTPRQPRFVPTDESAKNILLQAFSKYVEDVSTGRYPAERHQYQMTEKR
ncbi:MAG TPA: 3-methyl-2-oxobutanoate hydroxymethyltransferase, partial [Tepidisphaeraceae bacterium]|nr:3-methyl-2-oxobutanoate hydroxymethyltransferase [Tepidisphaeraceae bacterium]